MEPIIKKAIEGGYLEGIEIKEISDLGVYGCTKNENKWPINRSTSGIVLDPLFWQSLGKACGWENTSSISLKLIRSMEPKCIDGSMGKIASEWEYHAVCFHYINLTEGWDKAVGYLSEITK